MSLKNIRLLKRNKRLQQPLLDKAVRLPDETITGILIMLICEGIFYSQYRLKQKSNRLVSQKNQIITENESFDRLIKEKQLLLKKVYHCVKKQSSYYFKPYEISIYFPGK